MKFLFCLTFISFFLCYSVFPQRDQQLRISGKVTDDTGEPLPGSGVQVKGTMTATSTDYYGDYTILVPGEDAVLVFSFVGFSNQEILIGNQRKIDISLRPSLTDLGTIVVTDQAKGQIGAQQQQIASSSIVNVVSVERLQENPDANAVEAIGRLPGISIIRSGGEGSGIVIRGLEPKYSNITMDGIKLPSTSENERGSDISGISQYVLQGVEVFKALTPDMEANSVGGTINLKLQETPPRLHFNVLAQAGYNHLNNYLGNYKFQGEVSNRFFDNKFGVALSLNAERVNRSVETMSTDYVLEAADVDILLKSISLNKIIRINARQSGTLKLDYQVHPSTKLKLYGLFANMDRDNESQSKNYAITGAGSVTYNQAQSINRKEHMLHTSLTGETKLNFLNTILNYGLAYSFTNIDDPLSRTWSDSWENASTNVITTREQRRLDPIVMIPMFDDDPDSLHNAMLSNFTMRNETMKDNNLTSFMNIEIPYKIGEAITGYVKFGGQFRVKNRFRDITSGRAGISLSFLNLFDELTDALDWVQINDRLTQQSISLVNTEDYIVDDYLGGDYDYGWWFRYDRLNQISDWWTVFCDTLYAQGQEVWGKYFYTRHHMGFNQQVRPCIIDDQDMRENYGASYLMTELNIGKWFMILPGVRYEETNAKMNGTYAIEPFHPDPTFFPIPAKDTSATRSDVFLLPMIHMRIKPHKSFFLHLAYTQTLSRPDFNAISPNTHVNPETTPHSYIAQNPQLKAEHWTNYDVQLTLFSSKIGLLSISGFYKTVQDKIWQRSYKRISTDPVIDPFDANASVDVTIWENHPYDVTLKGLEFEWQTSFYYLPSPLNLFTLNLNYTITNSETSYPYTRLELRIPPEGGRPRTYRVDSITTGPMLFQPKHIGNASLGFNIKEFNIWLSFQYNGGICTYKHYVLDDLDQLKEHFYRLDLQMTYELPIKKMPGKLQIIANGANLTNFNETSRLRGDPRFTYQEAYGWTADLGVRYRF